MEFFDWTMLGTFAGASTAVAVITQFTKELPGIKKIPTQVWSYILSLVVLMMAHLATGDLTWASAGLVVFNAFLVSLSANGEYAAAKKLTDAVSAKTE